MIDTDHSENTTIGEFDVWSELVKPGGLLLFDDVHAYDNLKREDFGCGVFWNRLKAKYPDRCLDVPQLHTGGYGFGIYFVPEK